MYEFYEVDYLKEIYPDPLNDNYIYFQVANTDFTIAVHKRKHFIELLRFVESDLVHAYDSCVIYKGKRGCIVKFNYFINSIPKDIRIKLLFDIEKYSDNLVSICK